MISSVPLLPTEVVTYAVLPATDTSDPALGIVHTPTRAGAAGFEMSMTANSVPLARYTRSPTAATYGIPWTGAYTPTRTGVAGCDTSKICSPSEAPTQAYWP